MDLRAVTTRDIQRNFSKILDKLDEPVVVVRDSRPEAVLLDYQEYVEMKKSQEKAKDEEIFAMLDKMHERNAHVSTEEVDKDVEEALKHVRSSGRH